MNTMRLQGSMIALLSATLLGCGSGNSTNPAVPEVTADVDVFTARDCQFNDNVPTCANEKPSDVR